jgi:hypothetical protein
MIGLDSEKTISATAATACGGGGERGEGGRKRPDVENYLANLESVAENSCCHGYFHLYNNTVYIRSTGIGWLVGLPAREQGKLPPL